MERDDDGKRMVEKASDILAPFGRSDLSIILRKRVLCARPWRAIIVRFFNDNDIWEIISLFTVSIIAGWYDFFRIICILCRQ